MSALPAAASSSASSRAAVSAPGRVGACGAVYSGWWTGCDTAAAGAAGAGAASAGGESDAAAAGAAEDGAAVPARWPSGCRLSWPARPWAPAPETAEEPEVSDHWVSHSAWSWRRRSSWLEAAELSAGSSAVVGAAGSAARPNPAALAMPVVPAASAEAAALPPESAPSALAPSGVELPPDVPDAFDEPLRFTSHQATAARTTIRMIQKTKSISSPSVRPARCAFPDATSGGHGCLGCTQVGRCCRWNGRCQDGTPPASCRVRGSRPGRLII